MRAILIFIRNSAATLHHGRVVQKTRYVQSPLLAMAAVGSGAALLVTILWRVSLGLALVVFATGVTGVTALQVSRMPPIVRCRVSAQVRRGLLIGLAATLAYDGSRLFIATIVSLRVHPFDTWLLFGYAILGPAVSSSKAFLAGTVYHYVNGTAFAVAYNLLFDRPHWLYGVAWALVLEAMMLTIYPGWLDLRGAMSEFTLVSVVGHAAYGSTLGVLSQSHFNKKLFGSEAHR